MTPSARLIAYYLPQFHPIPENDTWWGKGFTEWTNVAKAKPLFSGHNQPNIPADLGFYDLRVPETREAQAKLARSAGIEGFCYWHYWFAGRRLLERPFNEVLQSGKPDFPFCLAWANQTWSGIWHGNEKKILVKQTYPGREDHERHFNAVLPAFQDSRYIRVAGQPIFFIYCPKDVPCVVDFIDQWQRLAQKNGLPGIHFVANLTDWDPEYRPERLGFNAVTVCNPALINGKSKFDVSHAQFRIRHGISKLSLLEKWKANVNALRQMCANRIRVWRNQPRSIFDYQDAMMFFNEASSPHEITYRCAVPNWDNSPRKSQRALILQNSNPELFRRHLRSVLNQAESLPMENRIVMLKSWNEWAEGNYLEPDLKFGHGYLDVIREEIMKGLPVGQEIKSDVPNQNHCRKNTPRGIEIISQTSKTY